MTAGRFAPSPSGDLHVGNLRTALLAWLTARSTGRPFLLRVEDLDRVRSGAENSQIADLRAIGLDWDGPVVRQSERSYDDALASLAARGLVYECFCTRREIREAASAPHGAPGRYPGTCRGLSDEDRVVRRADRPPALRLRADVDTFRFTDLLHGDVDGPVDDVVVRRNDGVAAYQLAVVVDDAAQGVDQVVRGDDLLASTGAQAYLATLLGVPVPEYVHVPLALNRRGQRLAKRDGAVTRADLAWSDGDLVDLLARSLGRTGRTAGDLLPGFDVTRIPREPWIPDLPGI